MTDPKGKKPASKGPHEDDLPPKLQPDDGGAAAAGEEFPEALSMSGSLDDFQFSGPVEELDFTEPADFTFPTEEPGAAVSESSGEIAAPEHLEGEQVSGTAETAYVEPHVAEESSEEADVAGEGIAEVEAAPEEEAPKAKFALPAWVQKLEWVAVGLLAAGGLLGIVGSTLFIDNNPKLVTFILNIACPVLLGLIPYALWRSSSRWLNPPASALYTLLLALSAAALITGTWFEGMELSRYDWQYSKARVSKGKPRPVIIATPITPVEAAPAPIKAAEPAPAPAAAKSSAGPATKTSAEPPKK